jgi:hypothetical protein
MTNLVLCGSCGRDLVCLKTGAYVFFEDVSNMRSCDIHGCRSCGTRIMDGFGSWFKGTPEEADVVIGVSITYRKEIT